MERARARSGVSGDGGSELARGLRYHLGTLAQAGLVVVVALAVAALLAGWRVRLPDSDDAVAGVSQTALAIVGPVDDASLHAGAVVHVRGEGLHRVEDLVTTTDGATLLVTAEGTVPARLVDGELRWSVPALGPAARTALTPFGVSLLAAAAVAVMVRRERRRWHRHLEAVALLEALRDGELHAAFERFDRLEAADR